MCVTIVSAKPQNCTADDRCAIDRDTTSGGGVRWFVVGKLRFPHMPNHCFHPVVNKHFRRDVYQFCDMWLLTEHYKLGVKGQP